MVPTIRIHYGSGAYRCQRWVVSISEDLVQIACRGWKTEKHGLIISGTSSLYCVLCWALRVLVDLTVKSPWFICSPFTADTIVLVHRLHQRFKSGRGYKVLIERMAESTPLLGTIMPPTSREWCITLPGLNCFPLTRPISRYVYECNPNRERSLATINSPSRI